MDYIHRNWRLTNKEVENDVRAFAREVFERGDTEKPKETRR
jgi:hypothetical protein